MKVLLIGHSGFIGQIILKYILKKKLNLIITKYNKVKIPKDEKIQIFDFKKDKKNIQRLSNLDLIIHSAWGSLDNYNSKNHLNKILNENLIFLKKLIYLGAKNIIILGTCFEYGLCNGEVNENEVTKPTTSYGKAKKKLLLELKSLQNKKKFNLSWVRVFYIYGENQRKESLYSQIKISIKKGKKNFSLSNGNQKRDYLHVDVLAKKIVKLAFLKKNIGVVNVCSGKPVTIKNLVLKWKKKLKWNIKFNFGVKSTKKYEPNNFWGSIKKLNRLI